MADIPDITIEPFLALDQPPRISAGALPDSNPAGALTAVGMGMSILGGLLKGMSALQSGEYNAQTAENNARLSLIAAGDARARGSVAAQVMLLRGSQMASKQKAATAASGVDVNSGSAVQVQADTKTMSAFEALVAENNAAREAWGYEQRSKQFEQQAAIDRASGRNALGESILGGAETAGAFGLRSILQAS